MLSTWATTSTFPVSRFWHPTVEDVDIPTHIYSHVMTRATPFFQKPSFLKYGRGSRVSDMFDLRSRLNYKCASILELRQQFKYDRNRVLSRYEK